jgi:lipopolysaccharide transport system ATP-binding protein
MIDQTQMAAYAGTVIGIVGEARSGADEMLQEAVRFGARTFGTTDLAALDEIGRALLFSDIGKLRRENTQIFLRSHELEFLRQVADEIWWVEAGAVLEKGHPDEILPRYLRSVAAKVRALGVGLPGALSPSMRRGDGRAELVSMEALGQDGQPTSAWTSGEAVAVRVRVRFAAEVANPVIGILIRTRVGMEVYGTNTELERLNLGPVRAGDSRVVTFRFRCDLCPKEYTITAASHDPDGVWHDWMEDALAIAVGDSRYTAGVANLRASVEVSSD